MIKAAITGWGSALPSGELGNPALAAMLDVSEDWILQRTGIRSRRVVSERETTSSLAIDAGRAALRRAAVTPDRVELVITATSTPDYQLPATASLVQAELGCTNAGAFDVNAACSGFLYGLAQANAFIESGACRRVLLCGADTLSLRADYSDPRSCVLFGDGAGAVILEASDSAAGLGPFVLRSDGSDPELLYIRNDERLIRMQGREVYRRAVDGMSQALSELAEKSETALEDFDLVVAHQANARIVEAVADRVGISMDKVVLNIEDLGNTSAASIPLALAEAAKEGRLRAGHRVAVTAFGAGFAWGAGVVSWGVSPASPSLRHRLPELVGTAACLGEL